MDKQTARWIEKWLNDCDQRMVIGDRALAGLLGEAVGFPSLEALKECLDMAQSKWF